VHRNHDQNPEGVAEWLQEGHQRGTARRFLLQNGDALVLEGFAELDVLGPLRINGQRRHDHIGSVVNQLPNQTSPFLFATSCWIFFTLCDLSLLLFYDPPVVFFTT